MGEVAHCPEDGRLSIWYAKPAPHLSRYITAYDAYHARLRPGEEARDVIPPAWSAMRFALDGFEWGARVGRRNFDPGPRDALFGPSSHAAFTRFGPGRCACVGLTPLGWARFVRRDASIVADRIVPLEEVWRDKAGALRAAIERADDPAAAFDCFFTDLLDSTEPEDEGLGRTLTLLVNPEVLSIAQLAERAEMEPRQLARACARHFGFTPKLLLRRARFMRAMIRMLRTSRGGWKQLVVEAGYHDQSHFVRDCQLFLDMPISAFMRRPKPLFEASLRLRAAVLGAPAQVLHLVEEGRPGPAEHDSEPQQVPSSAA